MTQSAPDVIDLSAEPADALGCFRSELQASTESRPRRQPARIAAVRRSKRRRDARGPFEWVMPASLFACGLLIGALLTGPSVRPVSAVDIVKPVGTVPKPPAAGTVVPGRGEHEAAGFTGVAAPAVDVESGSSRASSAEAGLSRTAAVVPASSPISGYRGTLVITSKPARASVFVNGKREGETPLVLRGQRAGSRALRLELDGYTSWSRGVQVVADRSTRVTATLTRDD